MFSSSQVLKFPSSFFVEVVNENVIDSSFLCSLFYIEDKVLNQFLLGMGILNIFVGLEKKKKMRMMRLSFLELAMMLSIPFQINNQVVHRNDRGRYFH
jgi:hypothetical protein